MGASWDVITLGEVSFVTDFSANGSFADLRENVEYLSKPDFAILVRLIDYSRNWDGEFVYISKHSYDFLRKCQLNIGDVIIANIGANAGTLFRLPNLNKPSALGPNALVIKTDNFPNTSREFLYYYFISPEGQNQIQSIITGSAQPKFTKTDLRNLKIPFPSLPEQRAIAGVLGALDDKIELNRRMNRTLESMARAVFREMAKSEIERVKIRKLGDICDFAYGRSLKEDERQAGPIPVYGSNGQIGWHNDYLVKGPGIVVGRKGNPGIVTWSHCDFFPIDTTFYVVPKDTVTSLYWLYYALISLSLSDLGADSAVPGLNRNIAYNSDVEYPSRNMMDNFDVFVKPVFAKINANEKESRTLASLRDSLLPKLMRGEVRVRV